MINATLRIVQKPENPMITTLMYVHVGIMYMYIHLFHVCLNWEEKSFASVTEIPLFDMIDILY